MIKICTTRISVHCYHAQSIQPIRDNRRIEWQCPACAKELMKKYSKQAKIDLVRTALRIHIGG